MSDVDFGGLVCISFVVIVLFHVGFSTPNWIKMQEVTSANSTNNSTLSLTTRTCHHGLFYSYDCPESENVFDKTVIALNIATFVCLTVFLLIWSCIGCNLCCGKKKDCTCAEKYCLLYSFFYASGGLFEFGSTRLICLKFDDSFFGWSFYLTVIATTIILLQVVLLLTYCICSLKIKQKCKKVFSI